jgi:hypothetical protein
MANKVGDFLEAKGVKFIREAIPVKIEKAN